MLDFIEGLGTPKDLKQAVKYFNLASQSGTQYLSNCSYAYDRLACEWYKVYRFTGLGHVLAIYHLGMLHATGNGIIRSCHTAAEVSAFIFVHILKIELLKCEYYYSRNM